MHESDECCHEMSKAVEHVLKLGVLGDQAIPDTVQLFVYCFGDSLSKCNKEVVLAISSQIKWE